MKISMNKICHTDFRKSTQIRQTLIACLLTKMVLAIVIAYTKEMDLLKCQIETSNAHSLDS